MNDMSSKLTVLGSGTCNIVADRAAASVLIERDDTRVVYDFGRGVATRLVEAGLKQDDVEHIFISHFHPDHVTDLYPYLHAASWSQIDRRTKDLTIYGPPGAKAFLDRMFSVFGWSEMGRGFTVKFIEVSTGMADIGGKQFIVVDLNHSYGLEFDSVAVAGDAGLSDELIGLLKDKETAVFDAGHLSDEEISKLASRTQAKKMIASHQYRTVAEDALNASARSMGYKGAIIAAYDGMKIKQ